MSRKQTKAKALLSELLRNQLVTTLPTIIFMTRSDLAEELFQSFLPDKSGRVPRVAKAQPLGWNQRTPSVLWMSEGRHYCVKYIDALPREDGKTLEDGLGKSETHAPKSGLADRQGGFTFDDCLRPGGHSKIWRHRDAPGSCGHPAGRRGPCEPGYAWKLQK